MSNEDSPAFPIVHPDGSGVQYFGMTLRDYFAAKAMQGIVQSAPWNEPLDAAGSADTAYEIADAMLAARSA